MRPYFVACTSAIKRQLRDRSALLYVASFYAMVLIAWNSIWWAAFRATGGDIHGYTYANVVFYLATSEASQFVASARRIEYIGEELSSGDFEVEMLRPVSALGLRLATEYGYALARLCVVVPAGLLMSVAYTRQFPNTESLALAAVSVCLASLCNTIGIHVFAALAFWLRGSKAAWFLYQKCIFLLGGMLIPIQLMPHAFASAVWALPFWTMTYAPGRLAAGFFEPWLIAGQIAWIGVFALLVFAIFANGERRVQQGVV